MSRWNQSTFSVFPKKDPIVERNPEMKKIVSSAFVIAAALTVSACTTTQTSTAIGAGAGALAGSAIAGTGGAVIGAAGGALAGNEIANRL